jgi:CRISPR-associated protein (TIGR02710 family)
MCVRCRGGAGMTGGASLSTDELSFDDHVRAMRRIAKGEMPYGDGSRYDQATRYYLEYLVEECAARAREACVDLPTKVDLLISVTGHSPRISVLAFKTLRPRRLVVIPSDSSQSSVNVIAQHVIGDGGLNYADFASRPCDATDPRSIYRIVKDELEVLARRDGPGTCAYIDITGGRKVMSATAALAAWQLDLGLCYLDGAYDLELGQAVPGSDQLLLLDNPTSLFGEQEMKAAEQAFDAGAYEAACNRFDELAGRLAQPTHARYMGALSALYRAWCDVDLEALPAACARVREVLPPVQRTLPAGLVSTVRAQLNYMDSLVQRDRQALLLCFSLLDEHYRHIGRRDFAALFSYRTIEGCLAWHLADRYDGFDCETPSWDVFGRDRRVLKDEYSALVNAIRGTTISRSLPGKVGVFAAAVLLRVLDDPLAAAARLDGVEALCKLEELVKARNDSILAHGEKPISEKELAPLTERATQILHAYWALHHPGEDLDGRRAELAFIRASAFDG